jgi:hypothetical protein
MPVVGDLCQIRPGPLSVTGSQHRGIGNCSLVTPARLFVALGERMIFMWA